MEAVAQDRAGWIEVVCGLCSTVSEKREVKQVKYQLTYNIHILLNVCTLALPLLCLWSGQFLTADMEMHLRCDEIFNGNFTENLMLSLPVKEF